MRTDNAMTIGPRSAVLRAAPKRSSNAFGGDPSPAPAGPAGWDGVRARIEAMDPQARTLAARQAEILTVAGQGLAGRPYAERKAILAHMTPHLAALGVANGPVGAFDPTDANLTQAVGEAVILRGLLGGTVDDKDGKNLTPAAGNSESPVTAEV